jgi:hypothetical protein
MFDAGDNMAKRSKHKLAALAKIKYRSEYSDASALVQLLLSAKISAEKDCDDGVCTRLIEQCILHLMRTHGLSQSDIGRCLVSTEVVPPLALLNVLVYAQAELLDALNDRFCAGLLGQCIVYLTHNYQTPSDVLRRSMPAVSH